MTTRLSDTSGTDNEQNQKPGFSASKSEPNNHDQTESVFYDNNFNFTEGRYVQSTVLPSKTGTGNEQQGFIPSERVMDVDTDIGNTDVPYKSTYTLLSEIENLRTLLEKSKNEIEASIQRGALRTQLHVLQENEVNSCNKVEGLQKENESLMQELNHLRKTADELRQANDKLKKDADITKQEADSKIQRIKERYWQEKERFDEQDTLLKQCKDQLQQCMDEWQALRDKNEILEERLSRKSSSYKDVSEELKKYKTRLSHVMGNRLSDNNPEIADLSDKNRPTKLGEKYQEIYDNQWNEAYEAIEEHVHDEIRRVKVLKELLEDIKRYCDEKSQEQNFRLLNAIGLQAAAVKEIPEEVVKQLKDLRKTTTEQSAAVVYERYLNDAKTTSSVPLSNKAVKKFVQSCVEVCWIMTVQDPPLALSPDPIENESFDRARYKYYTQIGSFIKFVVWPPLLLQEGGAVLSQGIAQAFTDTDEHGNRVPAENIRPTKKTVASSIKMTTQDDLHVEVNERSNKAKGGCQISKKQARNEWRK